ncbi:hypothetical protein PAE4_60051 [Bacillus altitudinis]|nr:hypothetical protein PAE4_60051 [Bacillus altitudinis]
MNFAVSGSEIVESKNEHSIEMLVFMLFFHNMPYNKKPLHFLAKPLLLSFLVSLDRSA